jgi:DNA-directed RNA polymerase specialized sigma24 family protein
MNDFDEFVADNLEHLLTTAYLITWDAGEADDLVQECLLKVARRRPRVRPMAQRRAYARRIAHGGQSTMTVGSDTRSSSH